jgi:hypothetical protein
VLLLPRMASPHSGFGEASLSIIGGAATSLRAVRNAFGRIAVSEGSPAEANSNLPKEGFRPDVEGLRAVAVVAVLLYQETSLLLTAFALFGLFMAALAHRVTPARAR